MKLEEIAAVLDDVRCHDYTFEAKQSEETAAWYLRAWYVEPDTVTGKEEKQFTRRWILTPKMTRSEIVSTAFLCVMTSMEHRTREWFTYKGHAIYMPHYNVDDLVRISEKRETR